jgi:glutamine amidotransferase
LNIDGARPTIAVIDYGIGNLRSAEKALIRAGADARLICDPATLLASDGLMLPGVGAFGRAALAMRERGLDRAAREAIEAGVPFLGVCVGMQLLYEESEESPGVEGLAILSGKVVRLSGEVKLPQMQWNVVRKAARSKMFENLDDPIWMYFVHSYVANTSDGVVGLCDYGVEFPAAIEIENVWATQFHPEKSSKAGLAVLHAFVELCRGAK